LVYDAYPELRQIIPLSRPSPGVSTAYFLLAFNTAVQGLDSSNAYHVAHDGTDHATIEAYYGGDNWWQVIVGGLTGSGSFTLSLRLDGGVRSLEELPLRNTLVSSPVVFYENYWDGGAAGRHALDANGDGRISLSELLRLIQFYNSGGLHCADPTADFDDSFEPGEKANARNCPPHSSDYGPQDWRISLSELLRAVQFYNAGGYHPCPGASEDGFCVGPAPE
jgi:hypothetical protein